MGRRTKEMLKSRQYMGSAWYGKYSRNEHSLLKSARPLSKAQSNLQQTRWPVVSLLVFLLLKISWSCSVKRKLAGNGSCWSHCDVTVQIVSSVTKSWKVPPSHLCSLTGVCFSSLAIAREEFRGFVHLIAPQISIFSIIEKVQVQQLLSCSLMEMQRNPQL